MRIILKQFPVVYFKYFTSCSCTDLETVLRNIPQKDLQSSPKQMRYLFWFLNDQFDVLASN